MKWEEWEFKVIFCPTVNSRPAWAACEHTHEYMRTHTYTCTLMHMLTCVARDIVQLVGSCLAFQIPCCLSFPTSGTTLTLSTLREEEPLCFQTTVTRRHGNRGVALPVGQTELKAGNRQEVMLIAVQPLKLPSAVAVKPSWSQQQSLTLC